MNSNVILPFEKVDTRLFRAFTAAAQAGSFTLGAARAGMTQSGMSQHIAKLEEQLGVPLFERVNKKVLLTGAGERLKSFIDESSERLERFVEELTKDKAEVTGLVRYAMPVFCIKTPHFPMLLEMRRAFPGVHLEVNLWGNDEILRAVLAGEIDFGFVTRKEINGALDYIPFAEEEYLFVSGEKRIADSLDAKTVGDINYVTYPGFETLFGIWKDHFFPKKESVSEHTISVAGRINSLDGAITMASHGVGATIVPRHCVDTHLKKRELFEFEPAGKANPRGVIYIVSRRDREAPRRVNVVVDSFIKMKKADQK